MARNRPVHNELREGDSRGWVRPRGGPNRPNVHRRLTQQRRRRRYQIPPGVHLPRNRAKSYRQRQVKRIDERVDKEKRREDQPTKLAIPNWTKYGTATPQPPS